jgi:hypothetical protein
LRRAPDLIFGSAHDALVVGVGGLTMMVNVAVAVCAGDSLSATVTVIL